MENDFHTVILIVHAVSQLFVDQNKHSQIIYLVEDKFKDTRYESKLVEDGGCTTTNCNNIKWTPWDGSATTIPTTTITNDTNDYLRVMVDWNIVLVIALTAFPDF